MPFLRHTWLSLSIICVLFAASATTAPAAIAATFAVNTTADTSDSGGCAASTPCSLRDAVAAANTTAGSTITLPAGHYTLNTGASPLGQLALTAATTIDGAGARTTTVDGNGQSRVFDFEPASVTDVLKISGLTVTGGSAAAVSAVTDPGDGGGIFSLGGLDLENVAVSGNTAALGGGGVMDGTIHGTQPGPATFNGVTLSGNSVQSGAGNGQGGGAVVATTLTMTNSTVSGNTVSNTGINEGGGLVNAIDSVGTSATLVNDTITGNSVAKPVSVPAGDMGGGIAGDTLNSSGPFTSVLQATNTIVAGNQADGAEQDCSTLGTGTSSHDIQGDASCAFTDSGSQTTTSVGLGTLQDNGGPTNTLLPSSSSPALDRGDATACPGTDERGVTRPQGAGCDIGAAELAPPTAITGAASAITSTSASVAGTATNPAAADGTTSFDYGTSTAYGQTAAAGSVLAGATGAQSTTVLTGLSPSTVYHYRIVVTTTDGMATGSDGTFTTAAAPTPVAPTPNPGASVPTKLSVRCSPATLIVGKHTVCTATVTDTSGTARPTGTVTFNSRAKGSRFSGSSVCRLTGAAAANAGHCSLTYFSSGQPSVRTIRARYAGDSDHKASAGSQNITVRGGGCGAATGSLSGTRLGPVLLGVSRSHVRTVLMRYRMRSRRSMDFFCFAHGPGIRIGYIKSRAALALTSSRHYHTGAVRPGDSLAKAQRTLPIFAHFRIGLNVWYLARGGASTLILKVRHGQVQEIGIATKSDTSSLAAGRRFMASFGS